jgi:MFS family permease
LLRERLSVDRTRSNRLLTPVFGLITLATFAYFVSVGVLIPTLPRYVEGPLGGGHVAVGIIIGAFSVTAVLMRPYAGRIGDRRGRRILMVSGATCIALATLGYVPARSFAPLLALRALTGVGEALFYVGAASAVNDLAPEGRRGEALSLFSLALYSGIAVGPVIGELVLDGISFPAVWLVSAGAGFAAATIAILLPETRAEHEIGNGSLRLVHPAGLLPGAALATSVWGLSGFNAFVPLYALDLGMQGSRGAFVVFSVIVLSIRSIGRRIPDRLGPLRTARFSLGVTAVGMMIVGLWSAPAGLFVGVAVFAVGQGLAFPALMTLAVEAAPPSERGSVIGTFTAFFDLAFGLGAVSLGAVSELLGYSGLFVTAGLIAFAGMGLMMFASRRAARLGGAPGWRASPVPAEARRVEESCEPY